jgi:ABC-type bacteriocin/lantibiotic exporter with double-glycine peptidase domain
LAEEYLEARQAHWRIVFRQIVGFLSLQAVASAALLGLGGLLVLNAELTLGQLVAAEIIVSAIVANLASLGKHTESFYDALAAVDKIGYVVDLPVERSGGETTEGAVSDLGARVDISDLSFGYDPDRPVLRDVSLSLKPGERVALVGAAGYGTSTLMDILMGIRLPQEGSVRIDGVDVRDWDLMSLRHVVALVRGQDLVETSIFENVRFGREHISRQQVRTSLAEVGLLNGIMRLPAGLDTELMVGGRPLSSSQRSRLILARAIVGRPRLLLLDENLENLEPQTFSELTDFVFESSHKWTLVVASRDLSVLQRCDRTIDMASFGPIRTGVTG